MLSCIDIALLAFFWHFIAWHLVACWALWPQFIHPANAECVAIGKRGKNLYSRLVYCKISDDIAVDSESQLLLPRASKGFTVRH